MRGKLPLVLLALPVLLALAFPSQAAAQSCRAPPGQAAIEQYCESVPGAGGDRGRSDPGGGRPRGRLPRALRGSPDGRALLGFTLLTSEGAGASDARGGRGAGGSRGGPGAGGALGEDVRRAADAGTGATLDAAFAWVLATIAAALLAAAVLRWATGRRSPAG